MSVSRKIKHFFLWLLLLIVGLIIVSTITTYAQSNTASVYVGKNSSVMVEYGKNFQDSYIPQTYGYDVGFGYNFVDSYTKLTIGGHGTYGNGLWKPTYKMGILLFNNFENYDVYVGGGVMHRNIVYQVKINIMSSFNYENEWLEIGIGLYF